MVDNLVFMINSEPVFRSQGYHQHKIVIKGIWVQFNNGKSYINEAITLDGYM